MDLFQFCLLVDDDIKEVSERNIRLYQDEIISLLEKLFPHISQGQIKIPYVYELSAHSSLIQVDHYLPMCTDSVNESMLFLVNLSIERGEFYLSLLHRSYTRFLAMLTAAAFLDFPAKIIFESYCMSYNCMRYKDELIFVRIRHEFNYRLGEKKQTLALKSASKVTLESQITPDKARWYNFKEFA